MRTFTAQPGNQSREADTIATARNFCSSGRVWPSSNQSCNNSWNPEGVCMDLLDSILLQTWANHWSQSSWLWPDCKNRNSSRRQRWSPVITPPQRRRVLFLTSLQVLSLCSMISYSRRSQKAENRCTTWLMTSQQKLESFLMKGSERATKTPWPWRIAA